MKRRSIAAALMIAAAFTAVPASSQTQTPIRILTGGESGVYYPLGVTIGMIYADIPGARIEVETSAGSVENLHRLQRGSAQLAFALGDSLRDAWEGDAAAGFTGRLDQLRVIGALYPSTIQIVATKASGIRRLADLRGKSLSVGAAKSGTELNARAILAAAGLADRDLGRKENLAFGESTSRMIENKLDATLQSAGLGVVSLRELSEAIDIVVVPVPPEVVAKLGAPFQAGVVPANTYFGQDSDIPTAVVTNYLVTSAAVSDDLAYEMTRRVFESLPELAIAHFVGSAIRREHAAEGGPVPLHPGAIRYYREKGLVR